MEEPSSATAAVAEAAEAPQEPSSRWHRTLDGIEDLARTVEDGQQADARRLGGSSAVTELVTMQDGATVIRKGTRMGSDDLQDADAEHAASMVARALGLRAPGVYRNDDSSIWMEYVADGETPEEAGAWAGELPERFADVPDSDDGMVMGLLDVLTHNSDRNDGNWLLAPEGQLVPIDHGLAYGEVVTDDYEPTLEYVNSKFADHYEFGSGNPLTGEDVVEVRGRLEGLRPDFAHIGQPGWLDYSLRVLDVLAQHASGSRNLIAGVR